MTYYLSPATIFGPLADIRIELILAALVFFVSLPALANSFIFKTPQSLAVIGLALAVSFSMIIGMHWPGGAPAALQGFIPNAYGYFLVCLHCNSKRKLQALVLLLLFVCLFVIARGYLDLRHVVPLSAPQPEATEDAVLDEWNSEHPYLFAMNNDAGETFYRLRGLGEINDPNDFGQLTVCVIPLLFIFWRPKKMFLNIACCHPAGERLGVRRLPHPLARCPCSFDGSSSRSGAPAHRDHSRACSRRRTILRGLGTEFHRRTGNLCRRRRRPHGPLGEGLQMLKSNPLFGVGFHGFADYAGGQTAHNSIVVCAGESACSGCTSGRSFLFPTLRDTLAAAAPEKVSEEDRPPRRKSHFRIPPRELKPSTKSRSTAWGVRCSCRSRAFCGRVVFVSRLCADFVSFGRHGRGGV